MWFALSMAARAVPLPGSADCNFAAVLRDTPEPTTSEDAWSLVWTANQCNRVEPLFPPVDAEPIGLWLADPTGDRVADLARAIALYAFGGAASAGSVVQLEPGLRLQARALDLLIAVHPDPTELGRLDDSWRFEAGPSAALIGEASLIRQTLATVALSRRDRRACEEHVGWLERVGRAHLGLPHEVQLTGVARALEVEPPEDRSCAAGFAADWAQSAVLAREVRARVSELTAPRFQSEWR